MVATLCPCGSGNPFDRCHGDPSNEFARAQALLEARQLAYLFPSVRLAADSAAVVDRLARGLGDGQEPSEEALDAAASRVPKRERRRLVGAWATAYPDRWASLRHTAGDAEAAEHEVVKGALDAAVHEVLPTERAVLAEIEAGPLAPLASLALLVPPHFVWSLDEGRVAAAAAEDRVDEVAAALGRMEHFERVQRLAQLVERELPFADFPGASAAVAEACAEVAEDLNAARAVGSLLLSGYAAELRKRARVSE
jgi:hypothetical protein